MGSQLHKVQGTADSNLTILSEILDLSAESARLVMSSAAL